MTFEQTIMDIYYNKPVDFKKIENLMSNEALNGKETFTKKLPAIYSRILNNSESEEADYLDEDDDYSIEYLDVIDDFVIITELFVRYGMPVSDLEDADKNIFEKMMQYLGVFCGENTLIVLRTLLDQGLSAELCNACWGYEIEEYCDIDGSLDTRRKLFMFHSYLHKLFLFTSYPHVLLNDRFLQKEIMNEYNNYDLRQFRDWNKYYFVLDTSNCKNGPEVRKTIITVMELETNQPVWKFGICIRPEKVFATSSIDRHNNGEIET